MTCGYEFGEFGDDGWGLTCELPKGHEGDHSLTLTWPTRPVDVCRAEGHVWGEWQAYTETRPNLFVSIRDWEVDPDRWRRCGRCKQLEFEGGKRNKGIDDILLDALFARPLTIPDIGRSKV